MGFMDKVKVAAGSAVAAVSDVAKDVTDKSKEVSEKVKLNRAVKNEEAKIKGLYIDIGQKFFNDNVSAPAGYESKFADIKSSMAEIEKLKKAIEAAEAGDVKINSGSKCPKCGCAVVDEQKFCRECGAKLDDTP